VPNFSEKVRNHQVLLFEILITSL